MTPQMPVLSRSLLRRIAVSATLAICGSLAFTAAAGAQLPTTVVGETSLQGVADGFLVPGPPGRVRVILGPCPSDPSAQGCETPGRAMDTVWLNSASGGLDGETFAHEMGHAFESYMWNLYFQQHARFVPRTFRKIVPLLDLESQPGVLASTEWTERFAEAYSLCARVGTLTGPVSTGYFGFETTPERHAETCSLIQTLAGHYDRALARARARH
jgi:hypothetical protein